MRPRNTSKFCSACKLLSDLNRFTNEEFEDLFCNPDISTKYVLAVLYGDLWCLDYCWDKGREGWVKSDKSEDGIDVW